MAKKDEDRLNIKTLEELNINIIKNIGILSVRLDICERGLLYNLKKGGTDDQVDDIYKGIRHIRLLKSEYNLVIDKLSRVKEDRKMHRLLSMYDEDIEDLCISLKVFDNNN